MLGLLLSAQVGASSILPFLHHPPTNNPHSHGPDWGSLAYWHPLCFVHLNREEEEQDALLHLHRSSALHLLPP